MRTVLFGISCFALAVGAAACTDDDSATNLHPEGPPEILQVRMLEDAPNANGNFETHRVFAFGNVNSTEATPDDEHPVTSAFAGTAGQISPGDTGRQLRIVMDELLEGNHLEEIQCRAVVDDDDFQRVPDGATPDDIARCSTAQDVLTETCTGPRSVCLCQLETGCPVNGVTIAQGDPVGVLDANQDGAADATRFIAGAVGIDCGGTSIPIDLNASYWNPSGDQQVPASPDKFDGIGPAIVLLPAAALPTNTTCGLTFAEDVVDKSGIQVCAPPGGAPADGTRAADCDPGDLSAFSFKTEALRIKPSSTVKDGSTGVSRTDDLVVTPNVPVDMTTLAAAITVLEGATPYTAFTLSLDNNGAIHFTWTAVGGLTATTKYTVTIGTALKDTYGKALPMAFTLSFTTGA